MRLRTNSGDGVIIQVYRGHNGREKWQTNAVHDFIGKLRIGDIITEVKGFDQPHIQFAMHQNPTCFLPPYFAFLSKQNTMVTIDSSNMIRFIPDLVGCVLVAIKPTSQEINQVFDAHSSRVNALFRQRLDRQG